MASTKGTVLLPLVKGLRANPDAARVVPPRLQHYLEERILVSNWYPAEDYRDLLLALGQLVGPSQGKWEAFGAYLAELELTGLYRSLLRENDPAGTLRNLTQIWKVQQSSGRIEVTTTRDGARVELLDFTLATRELCGTYTGYLRELVRLCGAHPESLRATQCTSRGGGSCVWEWSPTSPK